MKTIIMGRIRNRLDESDDLTYANDPDKGLIIAGWICAFLFQPIGIVIGIILLARQRMGHGLWMLGLSLLFITSLVTMSN
jgi:hypothetical protein